MYAVKVKVNVYKNQIQFLLLNLTLCLPIDANRRVWVGYTKMQLGIATQMFVLKVKITAAKIENQLLRYFSFCVTFCHQT